METIGLTQNGLRVSERFPEARLSSTRLGNRSGLRSLKSNEQSHDRGRRETIESPRATSDWDGVRRAKLLNGFTWNTSGRPAYSFPSDSVPNLPRRGTDSKLECFLCRGSLPPRQGWSALNSLAGFVPDGKEATSNMVAPQQKGV